MPATAAWDDNGVEGGGSDGLLLVVVRCGWGGVGMGDGYVVRVGVQMLRCRGWWLGMTVCEWRASVREKVCVEICGRRGMAVDVGVGVGARVRVGGIQVCMHMRGVLEMEMGVRLHLRLRRCAYCVTAVVLWRRWWKWSLWRVVEGRHGHGLVQHDEVACLFFKLEPDGALTQDDVGMIVRRDQDGARLLLDL